MANAYRKLLLSAFLEPEKHGLSCRPNSDSDGCFSRQQLFEIRSRFRQPNP